jgi:hypothetical protein
MTTEKENKPAFYIFAEGENGKRVGAAFAHQKGNGLNIVIAETRYVAFPPRRKTETTEEGA